ncbi:MAG: DUF4895 domain-containing protein [Kosmotoga sp.]|jgi:hypothetical protein|nr:MAG: DUF4895 domain-containing protein [Kosmotoga sp.]
MSIYSGPKLLEKDFIAYYQDLKDKLASESEVLTEREELLETRFGHFCTTIVRDSFSKFPVLSFFVDSEGKSFFGISSSSPLETSSAIYRFTDLTLLEKSMSIYKELFPETVSQKVQRVILQYPLKLNFIAICGNERLIRREKLKDTMSGTNYMTLSEKINDSLYKILLEAFRKWISFPKGSVLVFPYQDKIKYALGIPNLDYRVDSSIIIEFSRLFRKAVTDKLAFLKQTSVTPDMNLNTTVATVFESNLLHAEKIINKLDDFYSLYYDTINKAVLSVKSNVNENIDKFK